MLKQIYSVKDEKIGLFIGPFFSNGVVDALRSLTIAANDANSNLNRFSQDFSLYHLGTLDDESGKITTLNNPELITTVLQLINSTQKN